MKVIDLTRGLQATVDDQDWEWLNDICSWNAHPAKQRDERWYASGSQSGKTIYMHRIILDAPIGVMVDHVNGNGLDNRRQNLRLATKSQNNANRNGYQNRTGFRGVEPHKKRFIAVIWINHKRKNVGRFDTAIEAAIARDMAAKKVYGEFAKLNFPEGF